MNYNVGWVQIQPTSVFLHWYHLCMNDENKKSKLDIFPQNGYVLCKRLVSESEDVIQNGIAFKSERMPVYEVLKISAPPSFVGISDQLNLKIGDQIICNSSGTQAQVSDDEVLWLFKQENIAAKIKPN